MRDAPIIFGAPSILALLDGRKTQTRRVLGPCNTRFDGRGWAKRHKAQVWDWGGAWVDAGPSPADNPGPYLKLPWLSGPDPDGFAGTVHRIYPRHQPGMRLWVREVCRTFEPVNGRGERVVRYRADPDFGRLPEGVGHWSCTPRSSIHMPRWASRLTLLVTDVRVQRLQDIAEEDAIAEGMSLEPAEVRSNEELEKRELLPHIVAITGGKKWPVTCRTKFVGLWCDLHGLDAWDANPWVVATTFTAHPVNIDAMPEARHAAA